MEGKKERKTKRKRTDTFWNYTEEDNATTFARIFDDKDESYTLDKSAVVKLDHTGNEQHCWRLLSRKTGGEASSIRSTKPYRLSLLWTLYSVKEFWESDSERLKLVKDLPKIMGKHGDHCRHRCGYNWCCNPRHIMIGARVSNEEDKHYHFFLNHPDQSVRERFRETFPDLLEHQGVW